jgi:hypothetical protein
MRYLALSPGLKLSSSILILLYVSQHRSLTAVIQKKASFHSFGLIGADKSSGQTHLFNICTIVAREEVFMEGPL